MRALLPIAAAFAASLAGATLACGGYTLPMGALQLGYSPEVWTAETVAPDHWRLTPRDGQEGSTVDARIIPAGVCTEAAMAERLGRDRSQRRTGLRDNPNGLRIIWAEGFTGCRNLTAGPVAACVRHGARVWVFQTEERGCSLTRYGKADPLLLLETLKRDDGRPASR